MTDTKTKARASNGARALALRLFTTAPGQYEQLPTWEQAAALIDEELRELLLYIAHAPQCFINRGKSDNPECDCGLTALLNKWRKP